MKTKIFVLIIFLSINALSQSIIKKVYTDKAIYTYGETVFITIRAINISSVPDTIIFLDLCEAYPYVDSIDYLTIYGLGCLQLESPRIIPSQDSIEWVFQCPHPWQPNLFLPVGQHSVFGYFIYRTTSDSLIISHTDTISFLIEETSSIVIDEVNKYTYSLSQNYPNPFNPLTKIKYTVPELSYVTLKVYDILGNEISTLVNEEVPIGNYEVEWDASIYPSGIYFYRLHAGIYFDSKKMVLLK